MFMILVPFLQIARGLLADHPDLVEGLLEKAIGLLSSASHDDAGARAGLAQGLAALASSAATTAAERERRRVRDAVLPLAEDWPEDQLALPYTQLSVTVGPTSPETTTPKGSES